MSESVNNITQSEGGYDSAEFAKNARQMSVEIRNRVDIEGIIDSEVTLDHMSHNEGIYTFTLKVPRLRKDVFDYIPIDLPEKLLEDYEYKSGRYGAGCKDLLQKRHPVPPVYERAEDRHLLYLSFMHARCMSHSRFRTPVR